MARPNNEIPQRAEAYARGQVNTGDHAIDEHGALATGWRDGYNAALRDVRRVYNQLGGGRATAMHDLLKPRRQR